MADQVSCHGSYLSVYLCSVHCPRGHFCTAVWKMILRTLLFALHLSRGCCFRFLSFSIVLFDHPVVSCIFAVVFTLSYYTLSFSVFFRLTFFFHCMDFLHRSGNMDSLTNCTLLFSYVHTLSCVSFRYCAPRCALISWEI
ncbi:hypothetical protein J3R30DRAFT_3460069 [Lentinula aciculospora]|uniref:Uncharacterized protein n=1 Tax=Lentinula aciculospora TaxID=153920 RepID=A0A9W9AGU0_9AGAR|nr:hypothetical protein J3R30DRAFT_3460069 [Lentinula aciculospora]